MKAMRAQSLGKYAKLGEWDYFHETIDELGFNHERGRAEHSRDRSSQSWLFRDPTTEFGLGSMPPEKRPTFYKGGPYVPDLLGGFGSWHIIADQGDLRAWQTIGELLGRTGILDDQHHWVRRQGGGMPQIYQALERYRQSYATAASKYGTQIEPLVSDEMLHVLVDSAQNWSAESNVDVEALCCLRLLQPNHYTRLIPQLRILVQQQLHLLLSFYPILMHPRILYPFDNPGARGQIRYAPMAHCLLATPGTSLPTDGPWGKTRLFASHPCVIKGLTSQSPPINQRESKDGQPWCGTSLLEFMGLLARIDIPLFQEIRFECHDFLASLFDLRKPLLTSGYGDDENDRSVWFEKINDPILGSNESEREDVRHFLARAVTDFCPGISPSGQACMQDHIRWGSKDDWPQFEYELAHELSRFFAHYDPRTETKPALKPWTITPRNQARERWYMLLNSVENMAPTVKPDHFIISCLFPLHGEKIDGLSKPVSRDVGTTDYAAAFIQQAARHISYAEIRNRILRFFDAHPSLPGRVYWLNAVSNPELIGDES